MLTRPLAMAITRCALLVGLMGVLAPCAVAQTQIGFQAELSDLSTVGVSGTVTITGPTTLRFDNFNYDGRGGGQTELRLLPDFDSATLNNAAIFQAGVPIALLRGPDPRPGIAPNGGDSPPFVDFNGELDVTELAPDALPPGVTLEDFAGISVFCIPFVFDFGSGIFTSPSDFNNDGVVDAADYTIGRDTQGITGLTAGELGDANSDGAVTLQDLAVWAEAFGTVAAAADPNTSALISTLTSHEPLSAESPIGVPEPGAWLLVMSVLGGRVGRVRC